MSRPGDVAPEFSRIVRLDELGDEEFRLDVRATEAECQALAERFGLPGIAALAATVRIARRAGGRIRLRGAFRAEVTQTCVVTLEPIETVVEKDLDIRFEPAGAEARLDVAYDPSADWEPLPGDSLDVGEIIAEELALALDPYPRKPGASLEIGPDGVDGDGKAPRDGGPFEALAALKRKE